MDGTVQR